MASASDSHNLAGQNGWSDASGRAEHESAKPSDFMAHALSSSAPRNPSIRQVQEVSTKPEGVDEIPTATAASFFRTYFQAIHPQYPFLSVKECGDWYDEWKLAPAGNPISGWPAFFVKMVRLSHYCWQWLMKNLDFCNWVINSIQIRRRS